MQVSQPNSGLKTLLSSTADDADLEQQRRGRRLESGRRPWETISIHSTITHYENKDPELILYHGYCSRECASEHGYGNYVI